MKLCFRVGVEGILFQALNNMVSSPHTPSAFLVTFNPMTLSAGRACRLISQFKHIGTVRLSLYWLKRKLVFNLVFLGTAKYLG